MSRAPRQIRNEIESNRLVPVTLKVLVVYQRLHLGYLMAIDAIVCADAGDNNCDLTAALTIWQCPPVKRRAINLNAESSR